jgi:hypothetical protein
MNNRVRTLAKQTTMAILLAAINKVSHQIIFERVLHFKPKRVEQIVGVLCVLEI